MALGPAGPRAPGPLPPLPVHLRPAATLPRDVSRRLHPGAAPEPARPPAPARGGATLLADPVGARLGSGGPSEAGVEGVPQALTDAWFAEADWDGDGRLTGAEAKAFFGRTGLPVDSLSKVRSGWLVFPGLSNARGQAGWDACRRLWWLPRHCVHPVAAWPRMAHDCGWCERVWTVRVCCGAGTVRRRARMLALTPAARADLEPGQGCGAGQRRGPRPRTVCTRAAPGRARAKRRCSSQWRASGAAAAGAAGRPSCSARVRPRSICHWCATCSGVACNDMPGCWQPP